MKPRREKVLVAVTGERTSILHSFSKPSWVKTYGGLYSDGFTASGVGSVTWVTYHVFVDAERMLRVLRKKTSQLLKEKSRRSLSKSHLWMFPLKKAQP